MPSAYDRCLYVITPDGDHGPLNLGELREQTQAGRFQMTWRVRTATARDLGTVASLIHGARVPSQPRITSARTGTDAPHARLPFVVMGALALLGLGAWLLMRPLSPMRPEVASAGPVNQAPTSLLPPLPTPLALPPVPMTTPPPPSAPVTAPPPTRTLLRLDQIPDDVERLTTEWGAETAGRDRVNRLVEDGQAFVRLSAVGTQSTVLRHTFRFQSDERTATVTLRVRAQVTEVGPISWQRPRIVMRTPDNPASFTQVIFETFTTTAWQDLTVVVGIPQDSQELVLQIGIYRCTGHLDLASVTVSTP